MLLKDLNTLDLVRTVLVSGIQGAVGAVNICIYCFVSDFPATGRLAFRKSLCIVSLSVRQCDTVRQLGSGCNGRRLCGRSRFGCHFSCHIGHIGGRGGYMRDLSLPNRQSGTEDAVPAT